MLWNRLNSSYKSFFSLKSAPYKNVVSFLDLHSFFEMVQKTIVCVLVSSVVAISKFGDGISRQRSLESLNHQHLEAVDVSYDWLETPMIRLVTKMKWVPCTVPLQLGQQHCASLHCIERSSFNFCLWFLLTLISVQRLVHYLHRCHCNIVIVF